MPDPDIKTVVLIGSSHKFQYPVNGEHAEGIRSFHSYIHTLGDSYKIRAIAEEMNLEIIKEKKFASSGIKQLCEEKGLFHRFSDPSREKRKRLGIFSDEDIRLEGWKNNWAPEQINTEILARGTNASNLIREKFWLNRIKELDTWPLLFICGADHFNSFAGLLRENSMNVIEASQDWEP